MPSTIILQSFFSDQNDYINIPLKLMERNQSTLWIAMIGLGISFVLIALSKIGTTRLIFIFSKIILKNNSIIKIINDEYALTNLSSFALILNFILTTSILSYLTLLHLNIKLDFKFLYLLPLFPIYIFLWPIIWFNALGFITDESKIFNENKKNAIIFSQITGFLFSFLLLVWTFNLKYSKIYMTFFISIIILMLIYKFIRGIVFSFQHYVAWYYIILYFCTLEILPLALIFNFFQR